MKQAYLAVGARTLPHKAWKAGALAWSITSASILVVLVALAIAARGVITTGDYRSILSHQSLTPFVTIIYTILGALVASRHPRNPIGWIFTAVGSLFALISLSSAVSVYGDSGSSLYTWAAWLNSWLWIPGVVLPLTFVPLIFPGGSLPSPGWRWVAWSAALGLAASVLGAMLQPGPLAALVQPLIPSGFLPASQFLESVGNIGTVLLVIGAVGSLAAFIMRLRRSAGGEREQMKWLVYAGGGVVVSFVLSSAAWFFWPDNLWVIEISIVLTDLAILGIAVAAAVAILRYRLYDINLIINRTLVYTALMIGVAGLYGVVVGALGAVFQSGGNLPAALLATGTAAILVQPMRDGLQRAANRLMYGERDDPYAVLSGLSRQLEASLSPEAALPTVVETVAQALKLPYVAIALKQNGGFKTAASYGLPGDEWIQLPLIYQGETVGQLLLAPRSPDETFTPAERRLLEDIARHIGITAHTVHLNQDLRRLAQDLQRSRERLVTAREEERRRLRRDLHDGLGPVLASQGLKLAALKQLGERDPQAAGNLLDQLIARNEGAVAEIRRLVYDLRPPALDELGLVEAVRDQAVAAGEVESLLPVQVRVEAPPGGLPDLPAAVEAAAYRIALEALTNVYHHAQAETCTVRFSIHGDSPEKTLLLEICDDGAGLPERTRPGVGLASMKERAEEVGGRCAVEPHQEGGTRVSASFPLLL